MLRAVFFDAAGTLFETCQPIGESYAQIARRYGANVTGQEVSGAFRRVFHSAAGLAFGPGHQAHELRRLERQWWRERVRETFAGLHEFQDFDAYFDALFDFFGDPANWVAYHDVPSVLAELKDCGLQLGVVSNFDARLYGLLDGLGLSGFFDSVTISSDAGYAKPSPQIFELALGKHRAQPLEALHVGDAPHLDVAGAAAAGIEAILITRDGKLSALSSPAIVVSSMDELVPIVRDRLAIAVNQ